MEVKIGVQHAARELVVEYGGTAEDVQTAVVNALSSASEVLVLEDTRGRKVLIPGDRLAYVDIGEQSERHVGFGSV
ncbi:MAG: DUF3107 family protein [Streptosporangiales bacterium]|nr:DUF3107 family protein [Streptosporangiales bacterium]